MKEKNTKKAISSQPLTNENIQGEILYAEAVEPTNSAYNTIINFLIILFTLCLIYAIFDIASKIFAQ